MILKYSDKGSCSSKMTSTLLLSDPYFRSRFLMNRSKTTAAASKQLDTTRYLGDDLDARTATSSPLHSLNPTAWLFVCTNSGANSSGRLTEVPLVEIVALNLHPFRQAMNRCYILRSKHLSFHVLLPSHPNKPLDCRHGRISKLKGMKCEAPRIVVSKTACPTVLLYSKHP